jgi:hypothetical protein
MPSRRADVRRGGGEAQNDAVAADGFDGTVGTADEGASLGRPDAPSDEF